MLSADLGSYVHSCVALSKDKTRETRRVMSLESGLSRSRRLQWSRSSYLELPSHRGELLHRALLVLHDRRAGAWWVLDSPKRVVGWQIETSIRSTSDASLSFVSELCVGSA